MDLNNFLWSPASVVDVVVVNHKSLRTLLTYGLSKFFINGEPFFSNDRRSLPRNPPDCTILDSWVFNNFIFADELFGKALQNFETCLSVSKNLCGKFVSSLESPIIFDERFKVTLISLFVADFSLLSCELDNFTFTLL